MADFREYSGMDASEFLSHYGVGHDKGGHSGRYPWGSGKDRPTLRTKAKSFFRDVKEMYSRAKNDREHNPLYNADKRRKFNEAVDKAQWKLNKQVKGRKVDEDEVDRLARMLTEDGYSDSVAKQLCSTYGIKATKDNLDMLKTLYAANGVGDNKERRNESEDRSMFEGTAVALETMIDIMKRSPKAGSTKSRQQLDYMQKKLKLFQKLADGGDYTDAQLDEAQEASQLIWELMDEYDE